MNEGALVRKNLFRKPIRTTLLIISIFIAFLIFGILGSFDYAFYYAKSPTSANRLIVVNKINFTQPLPYAYLNRIRSIEGVTAVSAQNWFGGYYQDPQKGQIQTFPVEPEDYFSVYADDILIPPDQLEAFKKTRDGLIVGKLTAKQFGWKVGDHIPLRSDIYTNKNTGQQSWDFELVGIYDTKNGQPATGALFQYEYYKESVTFGENNIGWVGVKTVSADRNDAIAKRIDAAFANSPAETRTADELAFGRAFLAQLGDIGLIITLVVSAAFAAILMVVGNTMVMAIRERTKEIGVMKTLGFSSTRVVRMVLGESLLLSLIGAGLGLGLAALMLVGLNAAMGGQFGNLAGTAWWGDAPFAWANRLLLVVVITALTGAISWLLFARSLVLAVIGAAFAAEFSAMIIYGLLAPWVLGIGVTIAILFGLGTGLAPALNAFNLKIIDALGRK